MISTKVTPHYVEGFLSYNDIDNDPSLLSYYLTGDYTVNEAETLLPISDSFWLLEVTSADIIKVLKYVVKRALSVVSSVGYPHASGLQSHVDANNDNSPVYVSFVLYFVSKHFSETVSTQSWLFSRSCVEVNPQLTLTSNWTAINEGATYTLFTSYQILSCQRK